MKTFTLIIIIFLITSIIILWIKSMYATLEIRKILNEINENLKEIKYNIKK